MCSSPGLIAAYHVLHRLAVPRHPPCALVCLISKRRDPAVRVVLSVFMIRHPSIHPCNPSVVKERTTHREGQRERGAISRGLSTPRRFAGATRRSRKEVIQPQVPLRLPCYDFAPVTELTLDGCALAVRPPASGPPSFHGVTGGVYKARERIHRGVADPRLLAIPASCSRVTDYNPNLDRLLAISWLSRVRDALYRPL